MLEFWASLFFIALAEMGDKTQLIALSFATRYKPLKVLAGVFIATLAVHLFSVIIGEKTSVLIPFYYLKILIGISFIGFGIWTLKGDTCDEGKISNIRRTGPVMTVALAFFLAELGDKTQLATISLAAEYHSFWAVWIGSTLGMVMADGIAIVVGVVAGRKLPERMIQWVSAGIFILFGFAMTVEAVLK
ncbi:MAG TPA: TMEM165/GDT1 family protein [Candidatus Omnitrophota bacterium]|nr:TMEM165/GDT1 family protein [Candidatus Omnitrophota bacterium]